MARTYGETITDVLAALVRGGEDGSAESLGLNIVSNTTKPASDRTLEAGVPLSAANRRKLSGSWADKIAQCMSVDSQGRPAIRVMLAQQPLGSTERTAVQALEAKSRYAGNAEDHLDKVFCEDDNGNICLQLNLSFTDDAIHPDAT